MASLFLEEVDMKWFGGFLVAVVLLYSLSEFTVGVGGASGGDFVVTGCWVFDS